MKTAVVASALLGLASAVPGLLAPKEDVPAGCSASYDANFEITVAQVTYQKRDIQPRAACGENGELVITLKDGSTYDAQKRTGYIASNYQFQFDAPPQDNALYTSGFSLCDGNLLALGGNKTFYRCLSGDFYNLYNENWADQCEPVSIIALPCGSGDTAGQIGDGQVVGTTVVQTTIVTALPDGQPQVVTTQVSVPVTSYYPTSAPVTQISDGQVQAPPPVTPSTVATPAPAPVTSVETSAAAPTTTAGASAGSTAPAASPSVTGSASLPVVFSSSVVATTSAAASSSSAAAGTSSSASASASASTTAAPSSGSSRIAGSLVALVAPLLIALVYL